MKMTFTLPDALAHQFQAAYPQAKQSQLVAGFLVNKLRGEEEDLAEACRGANRLRQVEKDMADWEQLNRHDR
jgi:hypothetical protein